MMSATKGQLKGVLETAMNERDAARAERDAAIRERDALRADVHRFLRAVLKSCFSLEGVDTPRFTGPVYRDVISAVLRDLKTTLGDTSDVSKHLLHRDAAAVADSYLYRCPVVGCTVPGEHSHDDGSPALDADGKGRA